MVAMCDNCWLLRVIWLLRVMREISHGQRLPSYGFPCNNTHYTINGLSPYIPTHVNLSSVTRGHLVCKVLTEGDSSDLVPAVAVQDSDREEELMDDEM